MYTPNSPTPKNGLILPPAASIFQSYMKKSLQKGMTEFLCGVSSRAYTTKKEAHADIARIRHEFGVRPPELLNVYTLAQAVKAGHVIMPCALDGKGTKKSNWVSQQVFFVDVDNKPNTEIFQVKDALERYYAAGCWPDILYFTFSATLEVPRYRLVFALEHPIKDYDKAANFAETLCKIANSRAVDSVSKNLVQNYFGSNGEVWPCFAMMN